MYRNVLIALDGSRNAEKVLPFVKPILKSTGGKSVLVQVLPEGDHRPEAAASAYLKSVCDDFSKNGASCDTRILHGDPAVVLIRAADEQRADLVAFTSHGQGGLAQWIFGSVAQKILRGCARTLLVVHALHDVPAGIERVIVPIDGSLGSEAVAPHAIALARAFGAVVQLVFVVQAPGIEADDSKLRGWLDREKRRVEERLAEIERSEPGVKFEKIVEEGDPAIRILERAEGGRPAMIAMGNHGRTGFSRWVFGSVTEKILQAAKVPVLVARHTPS